MQGHSWWEEVYRRAVQGRATAREGKKAAAAEQCALSKLDSQHENRITGFVEDGQRVRDDGEQERLPDFAVG